MDKISSFQTLIGTLYKKYNKASVYGVLDLKTIYILNLINKLLYDCPTCITDNAYNSLINLAIKLKYSDKEICNYNIDKGYFINNTDIFNNLVLNNTDIKIINTAPVIEDPEKSDPLTGQPPKICENSKSVFLSNFGKHPFITSELVGCFTDPNNEVGVIQSIKITSLPIYNALTYQGVNVTVGQVINVQTLNFTTNLFLYQTLAVSDVIDSFTYQVNTSSYPAIYNEENITMFLNVGTP